MDPNSAADATWSVRSNTSFKVSSRECFAGVRGGAGSGEGFNGGPDPSAPSWVLGLGETAIEGLFCAVGDFPGGVGEVLVTWSMCL